MPKTKGKIISKAIIGAEVCTILMEVTFLYFLVKNMT